MTVALAQIFHLTSARSSEHVLTPRRFTSNPYAVGAIILTIALQLLAVYLPPLAHVLRLTPLTPREWFVVVGLSLIPAAMGQLLRIVAPLSGRIKNSRTTKLLH
jgi:Ca2+-transporting ATPase